MKKTLLTALATGAFLMLASNASAQNHDFAGSYLMSNFYADYVTGDYSMDDLPLVINSENVVENFANYTPFSTITGEVNGNDFTLTSQDEHMILDIDWDTFHYIILNGETFGDDYEYAPITLSYDPTLDTYQLTSWMLWEYDPFGETYEKIGYCMVFDIYPGEPMEEIDYTGEYMVSGMKTLYVDGVAQEPKEDAFPMIIRPDGDGMYEFTCFAGYEVGYTPKGWLGVFGPVYGKDIELHGTDIELNENGDGIKLAGPFIDYDDMYTVTIFFNDPEAGIVSDFDVWRMEGRKPVELLAKWSNLTFTKGGTDSIESLEEELNDNNSEVPVFYDLQGRKIQNPSNGIFILKQGDKTKKVLIRK